MTDAAWRRLPGMLTGGHPPQSDWAVHIPDGTAQPREEGWSCRTGVCHTCELAMVSGAVNYSPDPIGPPDEGNILICCSKPARDLALDL